MEDERNYWLAFSVFSGIGPMKFKMLLERFGSAKDAWEASKSDLTKVVGEKLTKKFDKFRNTFSIHDYTKRLTSQGVSLLILTDKNYPKLLSQIKNPPFVLYAKGDNETLKPVAPRDEQAQDDTTTGSRQTIAVVGSRKTTQYGREVTKILVEELVMANFTIVSGLAIGVDAISHKTAIDNGGKTIAVLGCGVDCCYPLANQSIYNSIVSGSSRFGEAGSGCVVSEYPLGQAPTRGSFPARNRIIAGLSFGVLVTEGAEDSGSLITASYAIQYGRPVFAVPGAITSSLSKGPYKLIQKGAKLVTKAEDILKEFKTSVFAKASADKQNSKIKNATEEELKILSFLQNEPLHFDAIVRETGLQSSTVGSILSIMEVKGMIKSLEGGTFGIEI